MNERLQKLKEALRMDWGELAAHLRMSRSMLDFARKGQRNLSFKAVRRLEELEREVGLIPSVETSIALINKKLENYPSTGLTRDEVSELREIIAEWKVKIGRIESLLDKL
jgi:transcriptional regulator with XRE-family HTH domain